jgi:hypothetical protein
VDITNSLLCCCSLMMIISLRIMDGKREREWRDCGLLHVTFSLCCDSLLFVFASSLFLFLEKGPLLVCLCVQYYTAMHIHSLYTTSTIPCDICALCMQTSLQHKSPECCYFSTTSYQYHVPHPNTTTNNYIIITATTLSIKVTCEL